MRRYPERRKPPGYWTPELIEIEARRHSTLGAFRQEARGAYNAARAHGIMRSVCAHMSMNEAPGHWDNIDNVRAVARCCSTRKEFHEKFGAAANAAARLGVLDDVLCHIPKLNKKARKWTREAVISEARKYTTRSAFERGSSASAMARRKGWHADACSHMKRVGDWRHRLVYVILSTTDRTAYVGLTYNIERRYLGHRQRPHTAQLKALVDGHHTIEQVTALLPADDAVAAEGVWIERLRSDGWTVINSTSAGGLGGGNRRIWTRERIFDLARTCLSRRAMQTGHPSAYKVASARGWIDAAFANHPNRGYRGKPYSRRAS